MNGRLFPDGWSNTSGSCAENPTQRIPQLLQAQTTETQNFHSSCGTCGVLSTPENSKSLCVVWILKNRVDEQLLTHLAHGTRRKDFLHVVLIHTNFKRRWWILHSEKKTCLQSTVPIKRASSMLGVNVRDVRRQQYPVLSSNCEFDTFHNALRGQSSCRKNPSQIVTVSSYWLLRTLEG